jgi:hypothetical protein
MRIPKPFYYFLPPAYEHSSAPCSKAFSMYVFLNVTQGLTPPLQKTYNRKGERSNKTEILYDC